jgi:hypothetical protein
LFNKSTYIILASILILSLVLSACIGSPSKSTPSASAPAGTFNNPSARKGTITTGQKVDAVTQSVDTSGGTIAFSKQGDPLDGLVINIPAQSYSAKSNFKVTYAPITNQTFGNDIKPASPLITVDNGGAIADKMIYMRIPAKVPQGYFAMGFIYDAKTGHLEGLPLVASDADSVTIGTTHFCDLFLGMIDKALLKNDIDSGFKPKVDDWQFTNFGSYIAPGGHCEGQSVTAMWYYCTKPDGSDAHLYGRYDNNGEKPATSGFWQDDSLGYRFASMAQKSIVNMVDHFWQNIQGKKWIKENDKWKMVDAPLGISDDMEWDLFAYSMRATGEPQLVNIWSNAGGGHAMVVYRIKDEQLYIADPNYPGNTERIIEYKSGKFSPYNSGANADEIAKGNGKTYEKIMYIAKTTVISWDGIDAYWSQLKNKLVGNDKFPVYKLVYQDDKAQWIPLADGTIVPFDAISIAVTSLTAGVTMGLNVYRDGENLVPDDKRNYDLKPGNNKLGMHIQGKVDDNWKYIDFKYVNVIYGGLAIDPLTLDGEVNKEYTFTVKADNPPANARYSWSVDNIVLQTDGQKTFKTTFKTTGKHIVLLKLLDASGKELEKAQATANIKDAVKLTVTPDVLKGETGKEYTFSASMANPPTGAITYEWSVNGSVKKSSAETSFKNTFSTEGPFSVTLRALLAGKEIAKIDSNVTITKPTPSPSASIPANNLAIIQKFSYMEASVFTNSMVHEYNKYNKPTDVDKQENIGFWTAYTPITWDGVKFSGSRTYTDTSGNTVNETLSGTVSTDGNTILTLTSKLVVDNTQDHRTITMVLQNVPLSYINGNLQNVGLGSANVQKYVVSLENSLTRVEKGATYWTYTYKSPLWDDKSSLTVEFGKAATR